MQEALIKLQQGVSITPEKRGAQRRARPVLRKSILVWNRSNGVDSQHGAAQWKSVFEL